jgi:hypothetical protein
LFRHAILQQNKNATYMLDFFSQLKNRNETLFYFGLICFAFSLVCLVLTKTSSTQVYNVSAWYKPFKFSASTMLFVWAMAWYMHYLPQSFHVGWFNWSTIMLLGFEIIYIAIQAYRGQLSHYNVSSSFYAMMYSAMAFAATAVTIYTGYVAYLFFIQDFPDLPNYYLWSIRIALVLFVIFSFEGFVMGSRMTHTIGGPDGEEGIPLLNWSIKYGDPRIAHFIGMHCLQVLPILSFYLLKNTRATFIAGILYGCLALFTFMQALKGKPMFRSKKIETIQKER